MVISYCFSPSLANARVLLATSMWINIACLTSWSWCCWGMVKVLLLVCLNFYLKFICCLFSTFNHNSRFFSLSVHGLLAIFYTHVHSLISTFKPLCPHKLKEIVLITVPLGNIGCKPSGMNALLNNLQIKTRKSITKLHHFKKQTNKGALQHTWCHMNKIQWKGQICSNLFNIHESVEQFWRIF